MLTNTSPLSAHASPAARRCSFCRTRFWRKALTARSVKFMLLPLPDFRDPYRGIPPFSHHKVRFTRNTPWPRSTSSHLVPSASPILRPTLKSKIHGVSSSSPLAVVSSAQACSCVRGLTSTVRGWDMTKVRYRGWADEVPLTEGAFEFEVTKREP
jgi:hypothetical protein